MNDLTTILNEALATGRGIAETVRMASRVTVYRKTGRMTQDETTGEQVPIWDDVHTDLPFRLAGSSSSDGGSRSINVGGVTYEQATAVGHFPAATDDLHDGDWIDVTSGEWTGSAFSIVAAIAADQKTARRLPIAEEQRPEEWDL